MVEVEVYNDRSVLVNNDDALGKLSYPIQEALRSELSYKVPDSEWSAKFKTGMWDGTISLYVKRNQSFPTGLTLRVAKLFDELKVNYKFVDKRSKPVRDYNLTCDFMGKELRDYQKYSGDLALKNQRGMLALATGAGKTMTSCYIFHKLKVKPVVFIVPAIELLKQTQKEFEKYLRLDNQPVKVGIAGGGLCDINLDGINVITYQTALNAFDKKYVETNNKIVEDSCERSKSTAILQKELEVALSAYKKAIHLASGKLSDLYAEVEKAEQNSTKNAKQLRTKYDREINLLAKKEVTEYKKAQSAWDIRQNILLQKSQVRNVIQNCNALIIDEAHLAAVITEEIGNQAKKAYYRLGLSATPFRTDNQEIRIEGTLGGKICEVSASDLVERGYLVPPKIFVVHIDTVEPAQTYHEVYNLNIINCWERNYRIKQFAEGMKAKGTPTLILVERKEHGDILESMIEDSVFVPGGEIIRSGEKSWERAIYWCAGVCNCTK